MKTALKLICGMVFFGEAVSWSCYSAASPTPIRITVGDTVIQADLNESATSRDFISKLPMTLSMNRWGDREYYGKVKLSAEGKTQEGFKNGDVTYWVPGGSFAVFLTKVTTRIYPV